MYKKKGFTLVELLLVITVIGILASFVFVSLEGARERAKIAKTLQWSQSIHSLLGADAVGVWNFNDRTAKDSSGSGNYGTIHGGAVLVDDTPSGEGWALKFDGVNDYVDVGNDASFAVNTGSFEAWIKAEPTQTLNARIVMVGERSNRIGFFLQPATTLHLFAVRGGSPLYGLTTPITADGNTWQHITGTWNSSGAKMYVNGVEVASWVGNAVLTLPATPLVRISDSVIVTGFHEFSGLIDEVRIYERALTASEIQKRYAEGLKRLNLAGK